MSSTPASRVLLIAGLILGCSGISSEDGSVPLCADGGSGVDASVHRDSGAISADAGVLDVGIVVDADAAEAGSDAGAPGDGAEVTPADAGADAGGTWDVGVDASAGCDGGGVGCYSGESCAAAQVFSLQENRDRLIADLAKRKLTDSCTLWAALNQAERFIFLMDTGYLGEPASRLFPPGCGRPDTALDHAVALFSINGPMAGQGTDHSGRGGNDYNRIYLGFDRLASCVMRNFAAANPGRASGYNVWEKSDDPFGPHAPFTRREMIFWYRDTYGVASEGPQFHHWAQDADFDPLGLTLRLGVCGVTDPTLTELTIAFDSLHSSDPMAFYPGRGGYGWQIVDQHLDVDAEWTYQPTGCPTTGPVNTNPFGGGTFAGMGPCSSDAGGCTTPVFGDGGT